MSEKKKIERRVALQTIGTFAVGAPALVGLGGCKTATSATPLPDAKLSPADSRLVAPDGRVAPDARTVDAVAAIDGASPPACVLTPAQTDGPFYFDPKKTRQDITEGKKGAKLVLTVHVVDVDDKCKPIEGAVADIWQADDIGLYSGYTGQGDSGTIDTRGKTFLRGLQVTDKTGRATFTTVYPGFYRGRCAHIHFKVRLTARTLVTSQLYFPDAISKAVYVTAPYNVRKGYILNAADGIFASTRNNKALVATTLTASDGYVATLTIGIRRS